MRYGSLRTDMPILSILAYANVNWYSCMHMHNCAQSRGWQVSFSIWNQSQARRKLQKIILQWQTSEVIFKESKSFWISGHLEASKYQYFYYFFLLILSYLLTNSHPKFKMIDYYLAGIYLLKLTIETLEQGVKYIPS